MQKCSRFGSIFTPKPNKACRKYEFLTPITAASRFTVQYRGQRSQRLCDLTVIFSVSLDCIVEKQGSANEQRQAHHGVFQKLFAYVHNYVITTAFGAK
jgi:hypothetical protein